jgi:hypothetical protein
VTTPRALLLSCLLAGSACTAVGDAFVCDGDAQCRVDGVDGRCEPVGFCSLPDGDCASGWRYDRSAGDDLAGACLEVVATDCDGAFDPVAGAVPATCLAGAPPTIDGDLADWPEGALDVAVTFATSDDAEGDWAGGAAAQDADLSARIGLRWDATYLYLAAEITDDQIVIVGTAEIWDNDSFELFVDGLGDRGGLYDDDDWHFLFRADGVADARRHLADIALPVGFDSAAVQVSATLWRIELRVPFAELGAGAVEPGRVLALDVLLQDREEETGSVAQSLTWSALDPLPDTCDPVCSELPCAPNCSTEHFVPLQLAGP